MTAAEAVSTAAPEYHQILAEYLRTGSERSLYSASQMSTRCIKDGLGPEDIVALHYDALQRALPGLPPRQTAQLMGDAHQFLMEVIIVYGVQYKEYYETRLSDLERRSGEQTERALEAERSGREKDDLLAMIAHELRTPITAAQGFIDLAARTAAGKENTVQRHLTSVRQAIDRMSRLATDLTEASRGEMRDLHMSMQDLGAILHKACSLARPAASSKDVGLNCEPGLGVTAIAGNEDALLSLFGNLLSNAIRYTPAGGRILLSQRTEGEEAYVDVSDSGIGIPVEVLPHIFDKFFRAPQARQVDSFGLGLGLWLVKQIVLAHGGGIEVASTPGTGSVFRVKLPLNCD